MAHDPIKVGDKVITLFSIFQDNRGDLWLGSHEHRAWKLNGTEFKRFKP